MYAINRKFVSVFPSVSFAFFTKASVSLIPLKYLIEHGYDPVRVCMYCGPFLVCQLTKYGAVAGIQ
jgi:hypothetical protein